VNLQLVTDNVLRGSFQPKGSKEGEIRLDRVATP
jgi:hypothetical protein